MSNSLEKELQWFTDILDICVKLNFEQECSYTSIQEIIPPVLSDNSLYQQVLRQYALTLEERIVLMLALIPHIRPQLLDTFYIQNKGVDRPFSEFGGWRGKIHQGFLPTGETAAFILSGNNLEKRFKLLQLFEEDHIFAKNNILHLENNGQNEPFLSGKLLISSEFLYKITTGEHHKPDYNIHFPAKLITTQLDWDDLVLNPDILEELDLVKIWLKEQQTLMEKWQLNKILKPGYRCLFYGPPGTGKTLTAGLIGKEANLDVYRIDISSVVSKYIGETEKNLRNVFDQAENKNWILFFDEADALFGKRTQTSSSNDRYANQEVSYLLQRIEDFPGVVILATNIKTNIDEAFNRRFQSIIHFPIPNANERLLLWTKMLPPEAPLCQNTCLDEIANNFSLSGGAIINVIRHCALKSLGFEPPQITKMMILEGINKELQKEGKVLNMIEN